MAMLNGRADSGRGSRRIGPIGDVIVVVIGLIISRHSMLPD
jgi:hypothetical protein